jgi:Mrp family chromosome partitioning ATPase
VTSGLNQKKNYLHEFGQVLNEYIDDMLVGMGEYSMSKGISIINLKGGVGKTTITVGLAEFLWLKNSLKS